MENYNSEIIKNLKKELISRIGAAVLENQLGFVREDVHEEAIFFIQLSVLKDMTFMGYDLALKSNPELQKKANELFKSIEEYFKNCVAEDAMMQEENSENMHYSENMH